MKNPTTLEGFMTPKRCTSLAFATTLVASLVAGTASAQVYPTRPVTLIVPYAPGGSADTLPRIIADHMRGTLGKSVVIENVTGAAGNIGTARIARAAPDGYTFGLGTWSTHVANAAVYALQYDVVADFEPIALIARSPLLITARKSLPANNLSELIAWMRANPDKVSQATNGPGSVMHVAGVFFQKETGTRFQFIPYRGAGPAMQALVAGHIDTYFGIAADIVPQAGNIKVYAIAAKERLAAAPDIPTTDEAGVAGLHVSAWFAFWAPKGTPKFAINALSDAVTRALADPAVRRRIESDLTMAIPSPEQQTPEALGAFQKAETQKWWPIIKAAKIKAE
jgi:tripartite-type tricarboxylate transporter receptor subunit TctC